MALADDLLGDVSEIRYNELAGNYKNRGRRASELDLLGDIMGGVTQRWFVTVFKVDNKTVARAVDGIKPVRISHSGTAYYAVRDVAPRLVSPEMSIEEYLATIKPEDLPEQLRESYWNVQAKSQKVRVLAGDLWRTADVIEVIGEVFKHVKNTIMLWSDTIEEQSGTLTDEQRKLFQELTDALQGEIHQTVVEQATKTRTRSQLKEIEDADE